MRFRNANRRAECLNVGESTTHYFISSHRGRGVPTFARVRFRNVYPGIDVEYYGNEGRLEYDWIVRPGADLRRIQIEFSCPPRIDASGDLRIRTEEGELVQHKPAVRQDGRKIDARYRLRRGRVAFEIARYDRHRPLIIDPVLGYATFVGGGGADDITATAVDSQGNVYLAGTTTSSDLPAGRTIDGAGFETQFLASRDAGQAWSNLGDLPSGLVYSLAIDPSAPDTLFAGGFDTMYKSTDGGAAWRATRTTFPAGAVQPPVPAAAISASGIVAISVDPNDSKNVYAGRSGGGIIRSEDNGESWTPANTGLPPDPRLIYVTSMAVDPFQPSNVWAVLLGNGIYRSTDGGRRWSPVLLGSAVQRVVFGRTAGLIYIATAGLGLIRSTDSGRNFGLVTTISFPASSLVVDHTRPNTLYSSAFNSFSRSTDGGGTWESIGLAGAGNIALILQHPTDSTIFYAIVNSSLRRSTDSGRTWRVVVPLLRTVRALVATPAAADSVVAATDKVGDAFVMKLAPGGESVLWTSYFGGNGFDRPNGIAVDSSGNAIIAGETNSSDYPTTPGAFRTQFAAFSDAFVAKLSANGDALLYSGLLGGFETDSARAVAVDAGGNAFVAGFTSSLDFPATSGRVRGTADAFVAKISAGGERLIYSAVIGGGGPDQAYGIALDPAGNPVVVGMTGSADFPVTGGAAQRSFGGVFDGFVSRLSTADGRILQATFLGGANTDSANAVAIDGSGNVLVAGGSGSDNFPTTAGAYQTQVRSVACSVSLGCAPSCIGPSLTVRLPSDLFVAKLSGDLSTLAYSTLIGGECASTPNSIAVDSAGNAYLSASTLARDFPLMYPVQYEPRCGESNALLLGVNADGSALRFSTYLDAGGAPALALDAAGNIYAAGQSCSASAVTGNAAQKQAAGNDGYLARIEGAGDTAAIALNSVVDAFSRQKQAVSPGEIVALRGAGLGPIDGADLGLNPEQPLDTTLADARVFFDDVPAPVVSAQYDQVVAVAPFALAGKTSAQVRVEYQGKPSNSLPVRVAATSPALLTADGSGQGPGNIRNEDTSLNSPENRAKKGSVVTLFLTGLGQTNPPGVDGAIAGDPPAKPLAQVRVLINLSPAEVVQASTVPAFITGFFQVQVRVPQNLPGSGTFPVAASAGSASMSNPFVTIAVE